MKFPRLSVLDQSPVAEGSTAGLALHQSVDLARLAESLGYQRYWLAEHHGAPGLACASPEVLIGQVAMATSRIRVGSGGIMMPHYSPLKVAETFNMLGAMYPGRIDLGLGRAAGTTPRIARALQRDRRQEPPDDFYDQLIELLGLIEQGPEQGAQPWLLGSSLQSAVWAGELGLPYAFADFINPQGAEFMDDYRRLFRPRGPHSMPRIAVAAWVICAETDEEAFRRTASLRMMSLQLLRGRPIPVPPIETALDFLSREGFPPETLPVGRRIIYGSPNTVRAKVLALADEYGAEEVLAVNILHHHEHRRRSYELLADAMPESLPNSRTISATSAGASIGMKCE